MKTEDKILSLCYSALMCQYGLLVWSSNPRSWLVTFGRVRKKSNNPDIKCLRAILIALPEANIAIVRKPPDHDPQKKGLTLR